MIVIQNHTLEEEKQFREIFQQAVSTHTVYADLSDLLDEKKPVKIDFILDATEKAWREKAREVKPKRCTLIIQDCKEIPLTEVDSLTTALLKDMECASWLDCIAPNAKRSLTIFWEV